jgi:hypothetical protein
MSMFLTRLCYEDIDSRYYRLTEPLRYFSSILGKMITVPVGFVFDLESVPIVKGTSNRGGAIHDYLCRKDNDFAAKVTKKKAADIYLEAMTCRDKAEGDDFNRWWRRRIKAFVVKYWPGRFFHRFSVNATYEELRGHIA